MNFTLQKIQMLLRENNWSLYRLSKSANIPYSSLNSMMNKNQHPTIPTLEKICAAFQISLSEFFADKTPIREPDVHFSDTEKDLIASFRNLSKKDKHLLLDFIGLLRSYK